MSSMSSPAPVPPPSLFRRFFSFSDPREAALSAFRADLGGAVKIRWDVLAASLFLLVLLLVLVAVSLLLLRGVVEAAKSLPAVTLLISLSLSSTPESPS